ncbi:MAG: putative toxin-antitoxin system toxin component, PIN family [Anaerolineae bacterium]|nr:putative toxin-antitoxin system toxin component, PIN family [Anaerolineae bacterium]
MISGLVWAGAPRRLLRLARQGQVQVVTSQVLLDELMEVLTRSDKSFAVSRTVAQTVVDDVRTFVTLVTPNRQVSICRDPDDNHLLACAATVQVDYIVTGDNDLLVLGTFEGIRIVNAKQFLEVLDAQSPLA